MRGPERAELERLRAQRSGAPLTVAYLDLDRFKELNDRAGHQAWDEVLAAVGQVLRRRLRGTDLAARIGGDEFAILLPETGAADATVVLESLRGDRGGDGGAGPARLGQGLTARRLRRRASRLRGGARRRRRS